MPELNTITIEAHEIEGLADFIDMRLEEGLMSLAQRHGAYEGVTL